MKGKKLEKIQKRETQLGLLPHLSGWGRDWVSCRSTFHYLAISTCWTPELSSLAVKEYANIWRVWSKELKRQSIVYPSKITLLLWCFALKSLRFLEHLRLPPNYLPPGHPPSQPTSSNTKIPGNFRGFRRTAFCIPCLQSRILGLCCTCDQTHGRAIYFTTKLEKHLFQKTKLTWR